MKLRRTELKKARIEIIPMIDAIFFLLVFFMMTSLQMVQLSSHRVNLPESAGAGKRPDDKAKVVVSVNKEGHYFVDEAQVEETAIKSLVAAKVKDNPEVTVVINCDKAQNVYRFVRVFDLIKQANAGKVMIATKPKEPGAAEPQPE